MKSSESLALIGPPKTTAPACAPSVSGKGSPKRGRLDIEDRGIESRPESRARLKLRRYRSRAQRRHAHAMPAKLCAQCLGEGQHIGLGRIINRHARPRQKSGKRSDVEDTAAMADQ